MGAIQLSDELQRAIDQHVIAGRAKSAVAFLEEAVFRLIDDARSEEEEVSAVIAAGDADIRDGQYITVETIEDSRQLYDGMMHRLRSGDSTRI